MKPVPANASRRQFIQASSLLGLGYVLKPFEGFPGGKLKPDHFLLGCSSLETGISFIKELTGVEAVRGGQHPNIGTHNALISLGGKSYLEIISPDPEATNLVPAYLFLKKLHTPSLFLWAAGTDDMDELLKRIEKAGYPSSGINPGSRQRPDGSVLKWRALSIETPVSDGVVPFFIEWDKSSRHPSADSPKGCTISQFEIEYPDPDKLKAVFNQLSIEVPVRSRNEIKALSKHKISQRDRFIVIK